MCVPPLFFIPEGILKFLQYAVYFPQIREILASAFYNTKENYISNKCASIRRTVSKETRNDIFLNFRRPRTASRPYNNPQK